jgi:hypothetical protein
MARRLTATWGISARSAFVAASVVFIVLGIAGAGLSVVLYRTMLSGVDNAAAGRVSEIADDVQAGGAAGVDPLLLQTDQRVVAVQVIMADGRVVRRSASAPDVPLIPLAELGGGLHVGLPEQTSPFGRIRFSALTVDGPDGRYTILVGEGSATIASTVRAVVVALAVAARQRRIRCRHLPSGAPVDAVGGRNPFPRSGNQRLRPHGAGPGSGKPRRDRCTRGDHERDAGAHRGGPCRPAALRRRRLT